MERQPSDMPHEFTPAKQRETDAPSTSQELLNDLMEGPRAKARYFNIVLSNDFPVSDQSAKEVSGELRGYQELWLKRNLKPINDEYRSIRLSSPEIVPESPELPFHIINQFIMPQWHRLLVSPKYPKMDTIDLETAQIRLAIESSSLSPALNNFEQNDLFDSELQDLDAMIKLLQYSIDSELHNQPDVIAVPHPEMGTKDNQADFILFELLGDGSFNKKSVKVSDIIDPSQTPGSTAAELLSNLRINSISRRPEFQDKAVFHKLILAHRKAVLRTQAF